jgi:hypothetical protein
MLLNGRFPVCGGWGRGLVEVLLTLSYPSQVVYDLNDFDIFYLNFVRYHMLNFCTTYLIYLVIIVPFYESHWIKTLPWI